LRAGYLIDRHCASVYEALFKCRKYHNNITCPVTSAHP
jgi:hypothetical protein